MSAARAGGCHILVWPTQLDRLFPTELQPRVSTPRGQSRGSAPASTTRYPSAGLTTKLSKQSFSGGLRTALARLCLTRGAGLEIPAAGTSMWRTVLAEARLFRISGTKVRLGACRPTTLHIFCRGRRFTNFRLVKERSG